MANDLNQSPLESGTNVSQPVSLDSSFNVGGRVDGSQGRQTGLAHECTKENDAGGIRPMKKPPR